MCAFGVFCLLGMLLYFARLVGLVYFVILAGFFCSMCVHVACFVYCVFCFLLPVLLIWCILYMLMALFYKLCAFGVFCVLCALCCFARLFDWVYVE